MMGAEVPRHYRRRVPFRTKRLLGNLEDLEMRKTVRVLAATLMVLMLVVITTACGESKDIDIVPKKALTYGDITDENLPAVCDVLEKAGLENVETFEKWVKTYNSVADKIKGQEGFADADCRMMAMLLMGDEVQFRTVLDEYEGDILMFDLDVIENSKTYNILRSKEKRLFTLFGEMPISIKGHFRRAYPENLLKHGIVFGGQKYQLITVLYRTDSKEEAFVGHTGLLIDCSDIDGVDSSYVFVEKLAFTEPYRITQINGDSDILAMLAERPELEAAKGEPKPRVYRNGDFIGEL